MTPTRKKPFHAGRFPGIPQLHFKLTSHDFRLLKPDSAIFRLFDRETGYVKPVQAVMEAAAVMRVRPGAREPIGGRSAFPADKGQIHGA